MGAPQPMPAVFFGHGNPLNALASNAYTQGWAAIGAGIPRPKAVLCVSAHWYLPGTRVTAMTAPRPKAPRAHARAPLRRARRAGRRSLRA
jgi:aromatic ring-opening dioxygenase catalytic subunit (LigB family)